MDNIRQGGKYSAQIASHQAELRKEGKFTDQKSLSISSLQTDYLNLDSTSGCVKIVREKLLSRQSTIFLEVPTILQKNASNVSESKRKNLVRLVIWTTNIRNARLANSLDVYLKIT